MGCCCVPLCSNRTGGHFFPKEAGLRKLWLCAIKRDKFVPNSRSFVCYKHFKESDYQCKSWAAAQAKTKNKKLLKTTAVPSIFQWVPEKQPSSRSLRQKEKNAALASEPGPAGNLDGRDSGVEIPDFGQEVVIVEEPHASGSGAGRGPPTDGDRGNVKVDVECQTTEKGGRRLSDYKDKPKYIAHYTGFEDYEHVMFVFHLLGPAAYQLDYGPIGNKTCPLSPEDAFFLTLIKLKRNSTDLELADIFGIPERQVSPIFQTWVNFMYFEMKEWDIKPCDAEETDVKIILDCTELKIKRPTNPVLQQATYSTYKSANTLKVLVGISPSCLVTHVSEAFCGSYSDKVVTAASHVLDQLSAGDVILADRGFQIEQFCQERGIVLNVPVRLKGKSQLSVREMRNATHISSRRIHVERSIGLAKTYSILNIQFHQSKILLAGRIVFVCFMLTNLRKKIV